MYINSTDNSHFGILEPTFNPMPFSNKEKSPNDGLYALMQEKLKELSEGKSEQVEVLSFSTIKTDASVAIKPQNFLSDANSMPFSNKEKLPDDKLYALVQEKKLKEFSEEESEQVEVLSSGTVETDASIAIKSQNFLPDDDLDPILELFNNPINMLLNKSSNVPNKPADLLEKVISHVEKRSFIDQKIMRLAKIFQGQSKNFSNIFAHLEKEKFFIKVTHFFYLLSSLEKNKDMASLYSLCCIEYAKRGSKFQCDKATSAYFQYKIAQIYNTQNKLRFALERINKALILLPNNPDYLDLQQSLNNKLAEKPKKRERALEQEKSLNSHSIEKKQKL